MINIYVSHSIRGKYGNKATLAQMTKNNNRAFRFAGWLRECFPDIKFYVPGELDVLLHAAGINPVDIVEELLVLDCAVIKNVKAMIVFAPDDYLSEGIMREINYCRDNHKVYCIIFPPILKNKKRLQKELTRFFNNIGV